MRYLGVIGESYAKRKGRTVLDEQLVTVTTLEKQVR
jgi:hypothetical protein